MTNVLSIKINFKMRKINGFKQESQAFSSKETTSKIKKHMTKDDNLSYLLTRMISGTKSNKLLRRET